jgi:hypothetical protein
MSRVCSTGNLIKKNVLMWLHIHVVKLFYMGTLCITLKERNIKRFLPFAKVTFDRIVMICYGYKTKYLNSIYKKKKKIKKDDASYINFN